MPAPLRALTLLGVLLCFPALAQDEQGSYLAEIELHTVDELHSVLTRAEQLLSIRRDFTIAAWANTQFRADTAGLEADIAALRAAGLPMT